MILRDVMQKVNLLPAPVIQSTVAGDEHVAITWSSVNEAMGYKIFTSTISGSYMSRKLHVNAE